MGIEAGFMIKHVRPYGMDAYKMVCLPRGAGSLHDFLTRYGVSQAEIDIAFNSWASLAFLECHADTPSFTEAARTISQARWQEFYQTEKSTIMFLDGPQLAELSNQSQHHAGQPFDFIAAGGIPISVTIQQNGSTHVVWGADGARVAADGNGLCVHFADLLVL